MGRDKTTRVSTRLQKTRNISQKGRTTQSRAINLRNNLGTQNVINVLRRGLVRLQLQVDRLQERPQFGESRSSSNGSAINFSSMPVSHFGVQYVSNEKPSFRNDGKMHPMTFLEDISSFLKKIPSNGNEIDIIVDCLKGEARSWARIYRERWITVKDFEGDFLRTYWGVTEQNVLRRNIVQNKWSPEKHPTMLGHFLSLTGEARMLTYKIPECQLVSDIMRHFPSQVQFAWSVSNTDTIQHATEFLRKIDDINKQVAISREVVDRSSSEIRRRSWRQYPNNRRNLSGPNFVKPRSTTTQVNNMEVVGRVEDVQSNVAERDEEELLTLN